MIPILVASAATGVMLAAWLHYLWLIPQERVPEKPTMHSAVMAAAVVLGLAGPVLSVLLKSDWALFEAPLELTAISGAGFFFYLMSQAPMPDGHRTFNVGDVLSEFSAPNQEGATVNLADFRGDRVLIKFFRGHW
ncbi:MAG: redoxin domain-containing protein [Rhodobacterales bacterium]|nr:redoxin domain-containing protein [Rhodobacterales bacterium]